MPDPKKVAAITAAVNAHMEHEAASAAALRPAGQSSLWQASGRMEIMQNRALWQRRIVPLHR